jgi:DNA repair protein RecN (Recombination protein N)
MIRSLRIVNFALIDELELTLEPGFTTITGETGSGKSILLGAIDLLLGERADFTLIGPSSDKAVAEASVDVRAYGLQEFFDQRDLDYSDEIILRRELSKNGRSRSFINDTPVQLTVIRELSSRLVSVNSQFNTIELRDREYQLEILDSMSGLRSLRQDYTLAYRKYREKKAQLEEKEAELSRSLREKDFNLFQLNELEGLDLFKSDYSQFEKELALSENSEQILQVMAFFINGLNREGGLLEFLGKVRADLDKIQGLDPEIAEFYRRTNSVFLEMKDLVSDIESYSESIDLDPKLKSELTEKIDRFNHALRKHNTSDQAGLISVLETFSIQVGDTEKLEAEITYLTDDLRRAEHEVYRLANELHEKRLSNAAGLSEQMVELLHDLKMDKTFFSFELKERTEVGPSGSTEISIIFSANAGMEPVPVERAASGGELSRVMLALQKLVSERRAMPTVIFDEIDTGVSGDVAQKIGNMLNRMGEHMQLIAITHLPQVAARANHHFKVEKKELNNRTITLVRSLSQEEHVEEIARLMSGEKITAAALENARELINS